MLEPKEIAKNYLSGVFWIDLISVIPFELFFGSYVEDPKLLSSFSVLKLIRVLRISKLINYMNSTEDVKHSLSLFKLSFLLVLYVHVSGCVWFYLNTFIPEENRWVPQKFEDLSYEEFKGKDWAEIWKHAFYASLLVLTGNDIAPIDQIHFIMSYIMLIVGAFINAHLFGTIADIV